jgi:hypothetical protein
MSRSYPPAPWRLVGRGVQTLHTVDVRDVRPLVPRELSIVQVWPGRTLGVVAFAHYGPGSDLEYNELIVAPALVRGERGAGVWISHIYVDDPASLEGGREIWGVPKELADFEWSDDGEVGRARATRADGPLAEVRVRRRWRLMRKRMRFPTYSRVGGRLVLFVGETVGRVWWGRGVLDVPPASPFGFVRMSRPKLTLWLDGMTLVCNAPQPVRRGEPEPLEAGRVQPAVTMSDSPTP